MVNFPQNSTALQAASGPTQVTRSERETGSAAKERERVYLFEFPAEGAVWYAKKSGSIRASSPAQARKGLVERGMLEPFEARVAAITLEKQ